MTTSGAEQILDAALEVLAERGYRGASLDVIAERAGLTRQGLLHYFPSKKRLLVAALERREQLNREYVAAGNAGDDWPSLLAEMVAFDQGKVGLSQVQSILLAESVTGGAPARQCLQDHYQTVHAGMVQRFTERYGERLPSGLTPRAAATAVQTMLNGLQQQWLVDGVQADHPEIMQDVLSVLLGCKPG